MNKLFTIYFIFFTLLASFGFTKPVEAAPPSNFQTTQIIGSGLDGPSAFEFAPDGRIFILQRTGEIKVYKNGNLLGPNFTVLPSIASGDRGLIGIAFDPNFAANKFVYFYYTGLDKLNHLVRMNATTDTGTALTELFHTVTPSEELHVGGTIRFGPDGKLYFAVGDNGYGPNAQNLSNAHGKILRINPDGSIPADNPFVGQAGKLGEIWAYGLRNPWRFQFDSVTGQLYDGDVGDDSWEEMNRIVKGGNYGWPNCEGLCTPKNLAYIDPIYTYPHDINGVYQSSAITQGPVYHGSMFPSTYQNSIFYGDYARGTIRRLTLDGSGNVNGNFDFDMNAGSVVDMKTAADGSLYYITYYPGRLYRITYSTSSNVPVANASADALKGTNPFTVHFSSAGSYDPDGTAITYNWNFGDGTTSNQANPTKIYTKDGTYTVLLTVSDGPNSSQAIPIIIQVGCPPIVTIGLPTNGSTYKSGDTIIINASAVDCVGFDINDASLSTTVKFHHTSHVHPFLDNLPGRSNSFVVPSIGEPSPDTWFEILVKATDTSGLYTTATTSIFPIKRNLTFATNPAGLQILLDGQPTNPQTTQGVVGFLREINVNNGQQIGNLCYDFDHWSDGGAQKHTITTQSVDTTYTAFFKTVTCASPNLVKNNSFETTAFDPWKFDVWGTARGTLTKDTTTKSDGAASAKVTITKASATTPYQAQLYQTPVPIVAGQTYTVSFSAKASAARTIDTELQQLNTPYILYWQKSVALTTAWQKFTYTVTPTASDANAFLGFNLAAKTGSVWIDDVSVCQNICGAVTPPPNPNPNPNPAKTFYVYDDKLATGWGDWTWSSTINFNDTSKIYAGTNNIDWKPTGQWAGFLPFIETGFDTTGYTNFTFAIQATKPNQKVNVQLYTFNDVPLGVNTDIAKYGGDPVVGQYKVYTIPLSDLDGVNKQLLKFHIQDVSGNTTNELYLDNVAFTGDAAPNPNPVPPPANVYKIFDDSLTTGWENWSWDATINLSNATQFYSGTKSLSYISNAAWSGLSLHNSAGIDTTGFTTLHFALKGTQAGQKYTVFLKDLNGVQLTQPVSLAGFGGDPTTSWKVYDIPLSSLSASGKKITEISIHDSSGAASPALYVDELQLK